MGGGSGSPNYTQQITQGLNQANLPKSPLSQQYNQYAQNAAPSIFEALLNAQNLGNSAFGGQAGGQRNASFPSGNWQAPTPNTPFNDQNNGGTFTPGMGAPELNGPTGVYQNPGQLFPQANMQGSWEGNQTNQNPQSVNQGTQLTGDAGSFGPSGFTPGPNANLPTVPGVNSNPNSQGGSNGLTAPQFTGAQSFQAQDPFAAIMQKIFGGAPNVSAQGVNTSAVGTPQVNLGGFNPSVADLSGVQGGINPQDSSYYQSIADILGKKQQRDVADTRAMFSGTGLSRGTPALVAESTLKGEQLPQLANALGQVRQSEYTNELARRNQVQTGLLGQSDQYNTATLGGRGQDLTSLLGNASNFLQAGGMNQQAGLDVSKTNAANNLNAQQSNQGSFLQNLSQLIQGGQASGQFNLGNQANQNQASQFNAGEANKMNLSTAAMQQQAVESQIQRAFSGLQNLLGTGAGLASQGQPGGSANINLGNPGSTSSGAGGTLAGLGQLIAALGGFGK